MSENEDRKPGKKSIDGLLQEIEDVYQRTFEEHVEILVGCVGIRDAVLDWFGGEPDELGELLLAQCSLKPDESDAWLVGLAFAQSTRKIFDARASHWKELELLSRNDADAMRRHGYEPGLVAHPDYC